MTSCLLIWRTKSSQNGVYSRRKESAPMGANSFLHEIPQLIRELLSLKEYPFALSLPAVS